MKHFPSQEECVEFRKLVLNNCLCKFSCCLLWARIADVSSARPKTSIWSHWNHNDSLCIAVWCDVFSNSIVVSSLFYLVSCFCAVLFCTAVAHVLQGFVSIHWADENMCIHNAKRILESYKKTMHGYVVHIVTQCCAQVCFVKKLESWPLLTVTDGIQGTWPQLNNL